jgi:hypothetical protein
MRGIISWLLNKNPSRVLLIPGKIFKVSASLWVAVTNRILKGMSIGKYLLSNLLHKYIVLRLKKINIIP